MFELNRLSGSWRTLFAASANKSRTQTRARTRLGCESLEDRRFLAADVLTGISSQPAPIPTEAMASTFAGNCVYAETAKVNEQSASDLSSFAPLIQAGDFNADGQMNVTDLDMLVAAISTPGSNLSFDLTNDGAVGLDDRDSWLVLGGLQNLGLGKVYQLGDADLDGEVDMIDRHYIQWHLFTNTPAWSKGDFNADGVVDGTDMGLWVSNKFQPVFGERATHDANQLPIKADVLETKPATLDVTKVAVNPVVKTSEAVMPERKEIKDHVVVAKTKDVSVASSTSARQITRSVAAKLRHVH